MDAIKGPRPRCGLALCPPPLITGVFYCDATLAEFISCWYATGEVHNYHVVMPLVEFIQTEILL